MSRAMKEVAAFYGIVALAVVVAASPARAQESGADVWARACGRCHRLQPPNRYDADSWQAITGHMALTARLTTDEEEAVREFLMAAARRLALDQDEETKPLLLASSGPNFVPVVQPVDGEELYGKHCTVCHGEQGKGDGPAASGLTPRPPDLTDADKMGELSDEELLAIIRNGKGSMPGFGAVMSQEELAAVLEFIRRVLEEQP